MHVTRRTFPIAARTAVAAGAAVALVLPAGAAFAEAGTGSGIGSDAYRGATHTATGDVRAARLADGSVARVHKLGPNHHRADIRDGGTRVGVLESTGAPVLGRYGELRVMLLPDGNVVSWIERAAEPRARTGTASAGVVMPDGRAVKLIGSDASGEPRAEVSSSTGRPLGALTARYRTALYGAWTYRLVPDRRTPLLVVIDGRRGGSGWVYDFHGNPIQTYRTR
ncbi:hypothetical protein [Streptomyces sp. NPDC127084]|uniref:hypothetical protein n=1 Tax=Streptomyces sp. NPDC127084 TaxID=3347133 RepID=UPI003652F1AE